MMVSNPFHRTSHRTNYHVAVAVALSIAAKANANTVIPTVVQPCSCTTYEQMQSAAASFALQWYSSTPPGFPANSYMAGNYTQIVVVSTTAPLLYPFTFKITDTPVVTPQGTFHNFSATVTPASTAPANMVGAHVLEASTSGRASNVPPVILPSSVASNSSEEELAPILATILFPVVSSNGNRTLPGLLNWSFFPSYKVNDLQTGKIYTLYNGDTIKLKFSDGTVVKVKVDVPSLLLTTGPYRLQVNSKTGQVTTTAPTTAGSADSLNGLQSNVPAIIVWAGGPALPKGTIIIQEIPDPQSTVQGPAGTVTVSDDAGS